MLKRTFRLAVISIGLTFTQTSNASAANIEYKYCTTPAQSLSCTIAFEKIKTLDNPVMSGKKFFDDGFHLQPDGSVFQYPRYYIGETDLDSDGFNEIIVGFELAAPHPEAGTERMLCQPERVDGYDQCPHFILQDRNPSGQKSSLKNIRAFGPYYYHGIALSTDEVIGGYRSLRAYKDGEATGWKNFDVLQYDKRTDNYYAVPELR